MKKIIYYVASSLDGYIAGPNEDVSAFIMQGEGVDQYQKDLQAFETIIMGRKTYEFGYQFGLPPGQPAYPNMDHYIFSNSLTFDNAHEKVHVEPLNISKIKELKNNASTDIYLCGGGEFAGWLLDHGQIDEVKLKLNPVVLNGGTPLFGSSKTRANLHLLASEKYSDGLQILTFELKN